ncbi:MAG: AzlD domain-containing protein [Litoreibacter sp.]|nr:AzlD domain-containing protein [Litoreibacter sp.]
MNFSQAEIWFVIAALGVGTFLIRFSFLGLIGQRELPEWVLRHLRYTAVAVLPALVAPLVVWPEATGGEVDLTRMAAAGATIVAGYITRNVIWSMVAGAGTLGLFQVALS